MVTDDLALAPTTTSARRALRRLLVASDGGADDAGAIRLAAALQRRDGMPVSTLTVVSGGHVERELDAGRARRGGRVAIVRQRLVDVLGDLPPWPLRVAGGDPAPTIAEWAERWDADLLVTGLGRHGMLDRIARHETVLHIARLLTVPMLAVPASVERLPRGIVLGVDVGQSSTWAGHLALAAAEPDAALHLVHVRRPITPRFVADELLAQAEARLGLDVTRTVHRAVVDGDPADALLAYADAAGADVIALGNREHTRAERLLLGSVATRVVRGAHGAVLL